MKKSLYLLAALALTLTACGGDTATAEATPTPTVTPVVTATPEPTPEATYEPATTLTWTEQVFTQEFTADDGTVVMTSRTVLPGIVDADTNSVWGSIHDYYTDLGNAALTAATENADWARDDYQIAQASGFEFTPYAQDYSYVLGYQSDLFASFLRTSYTFLGGAYPTSNQFSDTFDLATGTRLELSDLFFGDWESRVLEELIAVNTDLGYDVDYGIEAQALETHFYADFFYLTNAGVVIYFQPEVLGPHALGMVEYTIPYAALNDILVYAL